MGDGKWETNGVKVNHPTPRLGFDAFESRSTLADPRSITTGNLQACAMDQGSTVAQRTQNRSL